MPKTPEQKAADAAKAREWRAANRDAYNAYLKENRSKRKDRIAAANRKYAQTHPDKIKENEARNNARKKLRYQTDSTFRAAKNEVERLWRLTSPRYQEILAERRAATAAKPKKVRTCRSCGTAEGVKPDNRICVPCYNAYQTEKQRIRRLRDPERVRALSREANRRQAQKKKAQRSANL